MRAFVLFCVLCSLACGNEGSEQVEPQPLAEQPKEVAPAANDTKDGDKTGDKRAPTPKVETKTYVAELTAAPVEGSSSMEVGGNADLMVTIRPQNGWHMNHEFPTSVTVAPSEGVTPVKPKVVKKEAKRFDDEGADFLLPVTLKKAGLQQAVADVSFAVCTEQTCLPENLQLALKLDVAGESAGQKVAP